MAIYYLNPYTTTNGTGTFASPWSASSATRTGLTNGDEIRILGNTNPLFFSTEYTASRNSDSAMTIASGGGLGADWAVGNYGYIVEDDTFFIVTSISSNNITVGSTNSVPLLWSNTVNSITNTRTIRRVDTANNGASSTVTAITIGTAGFSNVVVSDAWANSTVRVTDGTVKSLFRTTAGSGAFHFESSAPISSGSNNFFFLDNSYVLQANSTSGSNITISCRGRDSVYNVAQFAMNGSFTNPITMGGATFPTKNTTVDIKTFGSYYGILTFNYGDSNTINIKNMYSYIFDSLFGAIGGPYPQSSNTTFNFDNITTVTWGGGWISLGGSPAPKTTVNIANTVDSIPTTTPSYALFGGGGDVSINLSPEATVYRNRRASTGPTTLTARYISGGSIIGPKIPVYTENLLPTISATSNVATFTSTTLVLQNSQTNSIYPPMDLKKPNVINIEYPSVSSSANNSQQTIPVNILMTYRDGSREPIEILGIDTKIGYNSSATSTNFANVFRDSTTFRTTGPSLRSLLTTRTAAFWAPTGNANELKSSSYKNIKIPIVSGLNHTITGYVRSSYSLATTNDVIMSVIYNNNVLASQSMTSAMYNSWEEFTLSFTATQTGEAYLVWEMYYPTGNMSYWLDDLSIVRS